MVAEAVCPTQWCWAALQVAYRIGRTMFETDSLPQHLVQHCNAMDEVWVPSEFNRKTFISAGAVAAAQEHVWPRTPPPPRVVSPRGQPL